MNTLVWIGFCQSVFAAIIMLAKKERSQPDKILSAWLILLGIEFFTCAFDFNFFGKPKLSSSFLLFNPALFIYIQSLTKPNFRLHWSQLLHLIPFVVFEIVVYIIDEPFLLDNFFKFDKHFLFRILFAFATILSWCIYNPLSLIAVHKHRMFLRSEKSNIERNENLSWVLFVAIFYAVYCCIAFIITVFVFFQHLDTLIPHYYNYVVLLFLVYVLSFYGLLQKQLPNKYLVNKVLYKNSSLSPENKEKIKHKLLNHFEINKAFLDPDLNMDSLAVALHIPKHQLTEVLSTVVGKNFFQFVNSYRIDAVKTMLLDSKNLYSIEAIGYECGFSSKSSFYSVFKELTGETPISFRKKIN